MSAIGGPAVPLSVSESFFGITTEVKLPVNCAGVQLAKPSHMRRPRSCWETRSSVCGTSCTSTSRPPWTVHLTMLGSGLSALRRHSRWSGTGDWVFFRGTQTTCLSTFSGNIHVCCIYGGARQMCHSAFSSYLYPLNLAGSWGANLPSVLDYIFMHCSAAGFFLAAKLHVAHRPFISIASVTQRKTII